MAKKSVKLGLRSGSTVESGDVNVTYNGVRIAGLSESTTATLETENTIVEHDIEIEYTKPAGGGSGIVPIYAFNTANDSKQLIANDELTFGTVCYVDVSGIVSVSEYDSIKLSDGINDPMTWFGSVERVFVGGRTEASFPVPNIDAINSATGATTFDGVYIYYRHEGGLT